MKRCRGIRARRAITLLAALAAITTVALNGQPAEFQFVIAAAEETTGTPVTENGAAATILNVEPYPVPVKLTIAVDNGPDSQDAIAHYRTGLSGLIDVLPEGVEVTIVSTAPQPRTVLRPTTDRQQIRRGITGFAPDQERPRFTDALVEYSRRLEREANRNRNRPPTDIPVLIMISTTHNEAVSYQPPEVQKALTFLATRRAKLFVTIMSTRAGDVTAASQINDNRQAMIAMPAVKATNGKYEALAISTRLTTLLPEWGEEIAALHKRHNNQLRVTVRRPDNATGPLQNLEVRIARPGLRGIVSVDGMPVS
jgi:hypothetical protein